MELLINQKMNTVVVIKKQIKLKPFIHIVLLYNQHDDILLPPPLTIILNSIVVLTKFKRNLDKNSCGYKHMLVVCDLFVRKRNPE